jgi:uncharacterized membrane protein YgdD (TMEM256/DUF423 family)
MRARTALFLGAVAMFVAVGLGAFGAHALKGHLSPERLAVWQTAVQYHAWHALALLAVGVLLLQKAERAAIGKAGWLFAAGVVLFSGSLYALALTGTRALGAVTPFGGLAFLAGWAVLAWAMWRD